MSHSGKIFAVTIILFMLGCGECDQMTLTQTQAAWVNPFKQGRLYFYKNEQGEIDTLLTTSAGTHRTPCNKFELSNFQFEEAAAEFQFSTTRNYNGAQVQLMIAAKESGPIKPYIHVGNLQTYLDDSARVIPVPIDTVLNGKKLSLVCYFAKGLNTEHYYGPVDYFK